MLGLDSSRIKKLQAFAEESLELHGEHGSSIKDDYSRLTVVSPISGVIIERHMSIGEMLGDDEAWG